MIDKTVPKKDYREHNGLFQVLDHQKVTDETGELYDIGKDYFGFDPYDKVPGPTYKADTTPDLIYIADTYGVYDDDLEERPDGEKSTLLYGGIDLLEWNAVMESKSEQTTLIAEFNTFASPTEKSVSSIMQKNLGVSWDGWTGRYFPDFESDEVPDWLIREYEQQSGKEWAFKKSGIAFGHDSGKVVVLDHTASKGKVRFTPTELGAEQFPSMKNSPYLYWFDIVEPLEGSKELASYSFDLTEKGKSMLQEAGIPTEFPAIMHNPSNKTYYFAGDFADYEKRAFTRWIGLPKLYQFFSTDVSEFYWKSYFPMISEIITQIDNEKVR